MLDPVGNFWLLPTYVKYGSVLPVLCVLLEFSKETCRIMISMLDRDRSGKMGFNEFKELWAALNQWKVIDCAPRSFIFNFDF